MSQSTHQIITKDNINNDDSNGTDNKGNNKNTNNNSNNNNQPTIESLSLINGAFILTV